MMNIVFSSTTQLAAAIRAGNVSATEVLEAHLAQIERYNPALNAVVTLDLGFLGGEGFGRQCSPRASHFSFSGSSAAGERGDIR